MFDLVSGGGVRKVAELEPTEVIALEVARADMHYVAATLFRAPPELVAAEIALVQYGAMAAYSGTGSAPPRTTNGRPLATAKNALPGAHGSTAT